jgi:hypothetical protein
MNFIGLFPFIRLNSAGLDIPLESVVVLKDIQLFII